MELANLLNNVKAIQVTGEISRNKISGIFHDSRKVTKDSVFVAIKGYKFDGHNFITDAINRGALAIVLEDDSVFPDHAITKQNAAKILVRDSRIALAELSNYFFNQPSHKISLIGVTGTNGKTTTTFFIKSVLDAAGFKTGLIGTIKNLIGDSEISSSLTTPECNELNQLLSQMLNAGCTHAVMEVSSHSLYLKRVYGVHFSIAAFTNLTPEHLDFHNSMENYFSSKKILFDNLSYGDFAIYNLDDNYGQRIVSDSNAKKFSYGTSHHADYKLSNIDVDLSGTRFKITCNENVYDISTRLVGDFNAYNACCAFAAADLLGIKREKIIEGIADTKQVPGRFEILGSKEKKVIIDYSHTPDSLQKALLAVKRISGKQRPVYTVFGCGGNRDRTKRPIMGKIATELSEKVIITSDNPRFENPISIINEIKSGISKNNFIVCENRAEAIKTALQTSEDNAVILIAGKGHENYQEINGVRTHFSDKEIAEEYLGL